MFESGPSAYNRPSPGNTWTPWDKSLKGQWLHTSKWSGAKQDEIKHSAEIWANCASDYLLKLPRQGDPFFLYVGFNSPHDPRQAPREYVDRYPRNRIEIPPNYMPEHPFDQGDHFIRDEKLAPFPRTREAVRLHRSEYYAHSTYMDTQIGRILDALEKSGHAARTYVIFTADHGLAVGQHGLMGKQNMYDHSIRMPLVVTGPGIPPGKRVDELVYQHSMFATTCELAGVPAPKSVEFPSLVDLLKGGGGEKHDAIFSYYLNFQRAVRTRQHKLIVYPQVGVTQLFDINRDPWEIENLAGKPEYADSRKATAQPLAPLPEGVGGRPASGGRKAILISDSRCSLEVLKMNRRRFLKLSAVTTAASSTAAPAPARRPNVLFIMSDDHAAHAIGAYGGRLAALNPTPIIDRIAREGIQFRNAFVTNSICTPSRATIMTGQYSHTNGVKTLEGHLEPSRQYLALLMRKAGYQTAIVGKWHLGDEPAFDSYAVLPGQGSYFNPVLHISGQGAWPDNQKRFAGYDSLHSSKVITDHSLDWLRKRDKSKPFFLMNHFKSPHDNFENAERYDFLYDKVDIPEPDSLWTQPNYGSQATRGMGTSVGKRNTRRNMGMHMFVDPKLPDAEYKRTAYQRYLKKYLRCVRGVDDSVGRILAYLEESGELDNTAIFYTSDQGLMLGEHDYIDKRWMYEESMRIPLLVRYPGLVAAGSRSDALVDNIEYRADTAGPGRSCDAGLYAGAKPGAHTTRRDARKLADGNLLPLLDAHGPPR